MLHKTRPYEAVSSAPWFVVKERQRRIRAREIAKEQTALQEKVVEQESPSLTEGTTVGSDSGAHESVVMDSKTSLMEGDVDAV